MRQIVYLSSALQVGPPVQLVDTLEVVGSGPDVLDLALWGVLHSVVVLFSQLFVSVVYRRLTHHQSVNVFLARSDIHGSQSLLQVQCLSNVFCASDNPQSEETGRATGTESVHADSLADWDTLGTTVGEDGSKSTVQRSGVHVSASLYAVG